ncbi:MAG: AAA family ATPase [Clostridiales bacterium]|nr:AAA family ATPase [Clostridiales bacterium]
MGTSVHGVRGARTREGLRHGGGEDSIRSWYNGYEFRKVEIYNPWSVMSYFRYGEFRSYWVNTNENTLIQNLLRERHPPMFPTCCTCWRECI